MDSPTIHPLPPSRRARVVGWMLAAATCTSVGLGIAECFGDGEPRGYLMAAVLLTVATRVAFRRALGIPVMTPFGQKATLAR